MNFVHKYT